VLPCYWIYWEVGKELLRRGSPDSRYQRWIDTYGGEEFADIAREVLAATDRLGPGLAPPERVYTGTSARPAATSGCSGTWGTARRAGPSDASHQQPRVKVAGLLGSRSVREAACQFHALCEGLAAVELRGLMTPGEEMRIWRDALTALVAGFAIAEGPSRHAPPGMLVYPRRTGGPAEDARS
jgi:hypothetical protein